MHSIIAAEELPQPLVTLYPDYACVAVTLESALPDGKNVTLHLGHHGEGGFLGGGLVVRGERFAQFLSDRFQLPIPHPPSP